MNEYDQGFYEETGVGLNRILICMRCGATVSFCLTTGGLAYQIHDEWHKKIERRFVSAEMWSQVIG